MFSQKELRLAYEAGLRRGLWSCSHMSNGQRCIGTNYNMTLEEAYKLNPGIIAEHCKEDIRAIRLIYFKKRMEQDGN